MKKEQLLNKLDHAWSSFKTSFSGLSEEQMTIPGVIGEWAVKDIIAHVNTWEEEALKHLPVILQGERTPRYSVLYGGIDAFNALMTARKQTLTLDEVIRQMDVTHQKLIAVIQNTPEQQFIKETRFRRRVRLDTYGHYPEHTRAICEWRELKSL